MSSIDGQHFVFTFTHPVIWNGSLTAFNIYDEDEGVTRIPVAGVLNTAGTQLSMDLGGGFPDGYVVTLQELDSIRGSNGALLIGSAQRAEI